MRNLITICGLIAAAFFGWQYAKVQKAESRLNEAVKQHVTLTQDLSAAKNELQQASNHLLALVRSQPVSKTNWVDERNRNWSSALKGGQQ